MSSAEVDTEGAIPTVRVERVLPDPPEVVWTAVTDRDELRVWFPCDVIVEGGEWKKGAKLVFRFPPDVIDLTLEGEVLEVERPRRLSYTWGDEKLTIELEAVDGGTRLRLENELPGSRAARNAAGWEICLARLSGDESDLEWRPRFDRYVAAFSARLGPQEGPPAGHKEP